MIAHGCLTFGSITRQQLTNSCSPCCSATIKPSQDLFESSASLVTSATVTAHQMSQSASSSNVVVALEHRPQLVVAASMESCKLDAGGAPAWAAPAVWKTCVQKVFEDSKIPQHI
jgi:hypothetical protein